jgi:hypothetical protein
MTRNDEMINDRTNTINNIKADADNGYAHLNACIEHVKKTSMFVILAGLNDTSDAGGAYRGYRHCDVLAQDKMFSKVVS